MRSTSSVETLRDTNGCQTECGRLLVSDTAIPVAIHSLLSGSMSRFRFSCWNALDDKIFQ